MEPGALVTVDIPTEFPLVLFDEPYAPMGAARSTGTATTADVGIVIASTINPTWRGGVEVFVLVMFNDVIGWQQRSIFHVLVP